MENNSDYKSESGYRKTDYTEPYHRKKIGSFLLFFLSFLPGANYMYMGFMKKGTLAMFSFFTTIYLISFLESFAFVMLLPMIWFFSFFDGFRIRRSINDGIYVEDSIDEVVSFVKKYTFHISIVLLIMFAFSFLSTSLNYAFDFFGISHYYNAKRFLGILPPILIIIVGYLIIRKPKNNDVIDKRNDTFK